MIDPVSCGALSIDHCPVLLASPPSRPVRRRPRGWSAGKIVEAPAVETRPPRSRARSCRGAPRSTALERLHAQALRPPRSRDRGGEARASSPLFTTHRCPRQPLPARQPPFAPRRQVDALACASNAIACAGRVPRIRRAALRSCQSGMCDAARRRSARASRCVRSADPSRFERLDAAIGGLREIRPRRQAH